MELKFITRQQKNWEEEEEEEQEKEEKGEEIHHGFISIFLYSQRFQFHFLLCLGAFLLQCIHENDSERIRFR